MRFSLPKNLLKNSEYKQKCWAVKPLYAACGYVVSKYLEASTMLYHLFPRPKNGL